ncbi:hypothetical protein [Paenibacillus sp. 2TAB19]|uniref:hypothetical protein n=1 Tax=Paenibacillus sp. 2TAB19 TaxID=3233003 RepID=UPI003F96B1C4
MAHMGCLCGNRLSNSLCPNDVQIRTYRIEQWEEALAKNLDVYYIKDLDIWYCKKCDRFYYFQYEGRNHIRTITYKLLKVVYQDSRSCRCTPKLYREYMVYTDIELDSITNESSKVRDLPTPRLEVKQCKSCNRVTVKEENKYKIFKMERVSQIKEG